MSACVKSVMTGSCHVSALFLSRTVVHVISPSGNGHTKVIKVWTRPAQYSVIAVCLNDAPKVR